MFAAPTPTTAPTLRERTATRPCNIFQPTPLHMAVRRMTNFWHDFKRLEYMGDNSHVLSAALQKCCRFPSDTLWPRPPLMRLNKQRGVANKKKSIIYVMEKTTKDLYWLSAYHTFTQESTTSTHSWERCWEGFPSQQKKKKKTEQIKPRTGRATEGKSTKDDMFGSHTGDEKASRAYVYVRKSKWITNKRTYLLSR